MKSMEILELVGQTPDKYVLEAQNVPAARAHTPKRIWLIAAVIAAMVFLMGCAWMLLRMEDLKIGTAQSTVPAYDVNNGEFTFVGNQEISNEILSVSGLNGSANYQAAQEWLDFMRSYDPNYAIMNSVWGNYPEFSAEYDAYDPYSQEMVNKLDEISVKYDLKLLGEKASFGPDKIHLMPEAMGIHSFLLSDTEAELELFAGNCYVGGNFQVGVRLNMPQSQDQWPYTIYGDMIYCRDAYFSADTILLNEDYEWEEWNYTTASGWNVLLIRSDAHFHGWIICKRENDMITVKIEVNREVYTEENGMANAEYIPMTNRQMELVADVIDFSIQPKAPDMDWIHAKLKVD